MDLSLVIMTPHISLAGANRSMLILAEHLAPLAQVCVVSLFNDPTVVDLAKERGLDFQTVYNQNEKIGGRIERLYRATKVLRREIRRTKAQLVLSNTSRGLRFSWAATRLEGCRLVVHQRDTYKKDSSNLGCSRVDHAIAISEYVKSTFPNKLQRRTRVIYNPIEVPIQKEIGRKAIDGWTQSWANNEIKIGVAGRCVPSKGQDILLRAAPAVLEKYPQATFHVWGVVEDNDEKIRFINQLNQIVEPFRDRVVFQPFRPDIEEFFQQMDIVVQPSRWLEPFGRVAPEAMAYATPTVAAKSGGLLEIIEENKTGWFHKPDDHEDLAQVLLSILNNPASSEEIARAGREHVINSYDPQVHAATVAKFLHEVVNPG